MASKTVVADQRILQLRIARAVRLQRINNAVKQADLAQKELAKKLAKKARIVDELFDEVE